MINRKGATVDLLFSAIVMVGCISAIFMLAQFGMNEINPANSSTFFPCNNSILSNSLKGGSCDGNTDMLSVDGSANLPDQNIGYTSSSSDPYTDTFTSAKNWWLNSGPVGFFAGFIVAPYSILNAMKVPPIFSAIIAAAFYLALIFLIVSWILGR